MTATFKVAVIFVLYDLQICIESQHVDKAYGNYKGAFVYIEKPVQIYS